MTAAHQHRRAGYPTHSAPESQDSGAFVVAVYGLVLAQQGARAEALSLLRTALAYQQEIGHMKAAEHAALLARLEAGADLPPALHIPTDQRAVGADQDASMEDDAQP